MYKKIKKIIFFLGIILAFFLRANFVLAFDFEVRYPQLTVFGQVFKITDVSTLHDYVCYLLGLGTNLALFITVIVIAFGGIYYLIDYGRGKFTNEGKDWIKAGVSGFLIVILASLIVYTINPNLNTCTFGILSWLINPFENLLPPSNVTVTTYQEIPIGTLTETLLTRKIDCYGFDQYGDPIFGDEIETDTGDKMAGPTYMEHDREDCLTLLVEGAQKKAQLTAALTDEIAKLMNQCDCEQYGNCTRDGTCPPPNGLICYPPADPSCSPGSDCCPPPGGKNQIEHGDINVPASYGDINIPSTCSGSAGTYKGLDEFRCPNPNNSDAPCFVDPDSDTGTEMIDWVETSEKVNGRTITIINKDKWKNLNLRQQLTYFHEKIIKNKIKDTIKDDVKLLDDARTSLANCYLATSYVDLAKIYESTDQRNHIILKDPETFNDPVTTNPINVSKYCQGFNYTNSSCFKKCNDACPDAGSQAMQCYAGCADKSDSADKKTCIENCYKSRLCTFGSYNDFGSCMNTCQTDCKTKCSDKYLCGSDVLKICQDQCKNNGQCVLNNAGQCLLNANNFASCGKQATDQGNSNYCINNAYFCKNGSDEYAGYPDCAEASSICSSYTDETSCENQNKCVWDGTKCWLSHSASFFYNDKINNGGKLQKCPYPYNPPEINTPCYSPTGGNTSCQGLCPETAKCPGSSNCPNCLCDQIDTLEFSIPNKSDSSNAGNEGYITSSRVISAYQITGPECNGYSYNDDPLTFYCEDNWRFPTSVSRQGLNPAPIGKEKIIDLKKGGEVPVGQTVDDAENWADKLMNNPKMDKVNEDIQTMIKQMKKIGEAGNDRGKAYHYCGCDAEFDMNNGPICVTSCGYNPTGISISAQPPGCGILCDPPTPAGCGVTCITPACPDCKDWKCYNPPITFCTAPDISGCPPCGGGYAWAHLVPHPLEADPPGCDIPCNPPTPAGCGVICTTPAGFGPSCDISACQGSPCLQITDYLSVLWNDYKDLKTDYLDFYINMIKEPRSDIIKELAYSRKTTDDCSLASTAYGSNIRLLSCTRVKAELISPISTDKMTKKELANLIHIDLNQIDPNDTTINGYCYGKELGNLFSKSLTDNWFCAKESQK